MYYTCAYYLTIVLALTFCSPVKTEVYNTSIYKGNVMNELNKFVTSLLKANMLPDLQAAVRRLRDLKAGHSGRTKFSDVPGENIDDFSFVPRFPCDKFDEMSRSCFNNRQIGTTLTVGVRLDTKDEKNLWKKYIVRWFRYFKVLNSENDIKEELTVEWKPWNINLGGELREMRISPITETDYSYNYFIATLVKRDEKKKHYVNMNYLRFYIEPITIDMGTLYYGEEIFLNARTFIELPEYSVRFDWRQTEMNDSTTLRRNTRRISSNMKLNDEGSVLIIKEFRDTIRKVLACGVYSNKNIFIARRDFLLRKTAEPDDTIPTIKKKDLKSKQRIKRSLEKNSEYIDYPNERTQVPDTLYTSYKAYNEDNGEPLSQEKETPPRTSSSKGADESLPLKIHKIFPKSIRRVSLLNMQRGRKSHHPMPLQTPVLKGLIKKANVLAKSPTVKKNFRFQGPPIRFKNELTFQDAESKLLAKCSVDSDCGIHANQPLSDESGRRVEIGPKIQLTQITTKFNEKHDEISLYLINFERKTELAQVPKKDWVAYLLAVLPAEISNMLAREPTERTNNYDFVKDLVTSHAAQKKLLEVENEIQGQSIEQFDEELNDDLSEDEKKTIEEVLPVVKELSVQDLIKTSPKVFVEEQHKSEQLKPLSQTQN
ncbi:uncharacterized protein TNIN_480251 [Trichonephila inaurata madagascariensis]|uniref:Uncharacterized protein n=1 Tax=Trichonephila inaurata madagascariensis TaxID=2747483 RepID=A0A8X6XLD3_9ARAC|nr:uncharacterized protein TNIN_480251 [Trichonephila inaurata madagascariensis]